MLKNIAILTLIVIVAVLLVVLLRNPKVETENKKIESTASITPTAPESESPKEENSGGDSLDLSGKGLDKLPSYVLDRKSLEVLDISNNNLTGALPGEIRFLQNLKVLNASDNKMTGVPAEIGQLKNLEVLDLSDNQLTGLPQEMGNLKNLKTLNLSGNDYSEQDLGVIKQGLPSDVEIIL